MNKLNQEDKTAVAIATLLMKQSPSGRIPWKKFRTMMEEDGYIVETDKSYTERIRYYIRKNDSAELEEPLQSVINEVGDIAQIKRETQIERTKLNKAKREAIDDISIIKEMKKAIADVKLPVVSTSAYRESNPKDKGYTAVITPSDWHTGLIVDDMKHETKVKRVLEYARATIQYLKLFNVTEVKLVDLGDIVENTYLHMPTSTATSEFNTSKQFAKYIELMSLFVSELTVYFTVTFTGVISGNHDRLSRKDETLTGDSFSYMATQVLAQLFEQQNNPRLKVDLSGYYTDYVNFKEFEHELVFVHGDKEKGNGDAIIRKYMSILDKPVSYIVKGHTHSFKVETESHGRKIFTSGTLNDANDYARGLGYFSTGSQMFLLCNRHTVTAVDIELKGIK